MKSVLFKIMTVVMTAIVITTAVSPTWAAEEGDPAMDSINLYVATTGSDTAGNGSKTAPFATLAQAQQAARKGTPADTTIWVEKGRYFLDQPLRLTAEDSGLTIRAVAGEEVVLSGAKDLGRLTWTNYTADIKVAAVEAGLGIDQLFINGVNQVLARYPNYQEDVLPLGGAATKAQIKARVSGYADPAGGYLRAIHSYGWGGNDYIITGKNAGNALGLQYQWVGDNNRGNDMNDNVVIENLLEELDAPNEWYYDNQSGKLYYYPGEGVNLSACTVQAAVNTELITIEGTDWAHPVTDITLDGFTYFGTKRTLFTVNEEGKAYVPLMRGDWCVVRAGAIYTHNTKNIAITHSAFLDMGGNGVFMYGYNDANRIDDNEFINIGATAVQIVGDPTAAYDASFWPNALYPKLQVHKTTVTDPTKIGPQTEDYPRDIVVSNNHMENLVFRRTTGRRSEQHHLRLSRSRRQPFGLGGGGLYRLSHHLLFPYLHRSRRDRDCHHRSGYR